MLNAHAQLEAVIQALRTTNWAGGRTAIAALAPVDQWIVDLYNRTEPKWLAYLNRKAGIVDQGAAADHTAPAAVAPQSDADQAQPEE
jgi:hypothetical protein